MHPNTESIYFVYKYLCVNLLGSPEWFIRPSTVYIFRWDPVYGIYKVYVYMYFRCINIKKMHEIHFDIIFQVSQVQQNIFPIQVIKFFLSFYTLNHAGRLYMFFFSLLSPLQAPYKVLLFSPPLVQTAIQFNVILLQFSLYVHPYKSLQYFSFFLSFLSLQ